MTERAGRYVVHYEGPAVFALLVAQRLTEAGGIVEPWQPPQERRDVQSVIESVVVTFVCEGVITAIRAGMAEARKSIRDRGRVDVDDPADRDQSQDP